MTGFWCNRMRCGDHELEFRSLAVPGATVLVSCLLHLFVTQGVCTVCYGYV